jgi:50S ribosomal protein L16 3-hydroxylase
MMAQRDNRVMDVKLARTLLGGLTPAQFMRRHWHKKPLLVRQAVPGVAPPLERAALFALAARDDVESRLIQRDDGDRWRLRGGPLPRRALPPLARPGWTLLVQGLDLHVDAAHDLLSRFRFVPAARLDDLMLSYASDGGGVGPHTDSYDVFLLQVQGLRRWRVGRARRPQLRHGVPLKMLANFEAEHEWVLAPGDMLYLPPGWGHDGVAQGGDCMTASIGFRAPRADELAQALLARLADNEADVEHSPRYRDPTQAATDLPAAVPEPLQRFARQALARALAEPAAVERALGEWLTEPKAQVWFEARRDQAPVTAQAGVELDRRTRMLYDARHVYINGESLRAGGRDARMMQGLADRRKLDARAVRALSPQARALLDEWLGSGWLHPLGGDAHDC